MLTSLLLDRLTASAPARIVTVSSAAHARGRIDFADLQGERNYSGQRAYSQSKLASVMFTYELARCLAGTGVTATVLHPGVVRSSFGTEDQAAYLAVMIRVARLFMKTPAQGAGTPIYLASSPEVEGITGRYYANRKPKTSSKASYDTTAAVRLWQASADLADMSNRIVPRRKHLDAPFVLTPSMRHDRAEYILIAANTGSRMYRVPLAARPARQPRPRRRVAGRAASNQAGRERHRLIPRRLPRRCRREGYAPIRARHAAGPSVGRRRGS